MDYKNALIKLIQQTSNESLLILIYNIVNELKEKAAD